MGVASRVRKKVVKAGLVKPDRLGSWVEPLTTASEEMLPVHGLQIGSAWAIIGIFALLAVGALYMMSIFLIPVTLAIVVGMILGLVAERLSKLGVPRLANAFLLSSGVAAVMFFIVNSLIRPVSMLVREGPDFAQRLFDRTMPFLEKIYWLHITPETFKSGPMKIDALLENTGNVLHVLANSLTPAIVQTLIFLAALLLFLAGRVHLRKSLILAFRTREKRLTAIRVINAVEQVLGYYFATASVIYACLGVFMTVLAFAAGLSAPFLWGLFTFLACFVPFLGITVISLSLAIAGVITHDAFLVGLIPAAIFFTVHLFVENLVFPAVMGRQLEINPFIVFLAIVFWTWMWGAVGAMLALPLSLIGMTIINQLIVEEKLQPQLPK